MIDNAPCSLGCGSTDTLVVEPEGAEYGLALCRACAQAVVATWAKRYGPSSTMLRRKFLEQAREARREP